jgi:hypothetical protein
LSFAIIDSEKVASPSFELSADLCWQFRKITRNEAGHCFMCKWRGLPKRFGNWHTIYTRMNRWSNRGVMDRVFEEIAESSDLRATPFEFERAKRVEAALSILEGKWKIVILNRLFARPIWRFSELERAVPGISQRTRETSRYQPRKARKAF